MKIKIPYILLSLGALMIVSIINLAVNSTTVEDLTPAKVKKTAGKTRARVYNLVAGVSEWTVREWTYKGKTKTHTEKVEIWGFNGKLPGPVIRAKKGERVRIIVENRLPEPTSVHWHGLDAPNAMDGVPYVTQKPIMPGESFTYEFTITNEPGTYMYHSHFNELWQIEMGMYGFFIIEPEKKNYDGELLVMLSEKDSHYLINGKSFPSTDIWKIKNGAKYIMRFGNMSVENAHPMHIHGHTMTVVAKDGRPLAAPYSATTLNVAPGETYDTELAASANGGTWLFHCHIIMHVSGEDPSSSDPAKMHAGMLGLITYEK